MLSPLIVSAKTVKHIIYQYAELIDTRSFDELQTIMWEDFKMTGGYEINGLNEFLGAMQQLASTYDTTMHFIEILTAIGVITYTKVRPIV